MKMFNITLSRKVSYREDAIVTIKADTEEEARKLAEEGHINCIVEQDPEWKIINDSDEAGTVQIDEVEEVDFLTGGKK